MKKVLIVEDEEDVWPILERTFKKLGFDEFEFCDEGKTAKEIYDKFLPDFVLLDIGLVDGDYAGLEVLEYIKSKNGNAKVLMLSGYDSNKEKSLELGADGFLSKPVMPSSLKEAVGKLL